MQIFFLVSFAANKCNTLISISSQVFNTGFVQSWILEKGLKFAKQFSRPGQSLENGDKVWKNGKKSFFFSKLQQVLYKWNLFRFGQILFNLDHTFAAHHERSFVPAFLKVSIDHLFDNLSLEKEIIVLEKSMEKILNFESKNLYDTC